MRGSLLKGFDWENFGVLDWWPLMRGGHTCRFDFIYIWVPDSPDKPCLT